MGCDMTLEEFFCVFGLSEGREARIRASLDPKQCKEWDMDADAVDFLLGELCAVATEAEYSREAVHMTLFDRHGTPMKVILTEE